MICKCGKEFECYHSFSINGGEAYCNHCLKCGKGYGGDMCKGICPDCFKKEQDKIEKAMLEELKVYAENMLE